MDGFIRDRSVGIAGLRDRVVAIALGLCLCIGAAVFVTPASAQAFGWFSKLFGGGQPRTTAQPRPPGYDQRSDGSYARPHVSRHHTTDPSRVVREKDRPPPKNASVFVYVIGDAFGQNLSLGLDEALADRQDVAIIHKAKGPTGLVMTDFFDWPKSVDAMLATATRKPKPAGNAAKDLGKEIPGKEISGKDDPGEVEAGKSDPGDDEMAGRDTSKPEIKATEKAASAAVEPAAKDRAKADTTDPTQIDAAVMMIGSNDRQPIRLDGAVLKPGTPEWVDEYRNRVMAIDEAFQRKGIPLIWVGVPIARDDGFADDMAAFNDIYREAAAKTGAVYVDTWEAFSDDNGDFSASGPDINGQITRLRTADGIYFTKAGSRKLAHFVEVHVRRALDGKMARPPMPETAAPVASVTRKPDVGPISNLIAPPLSPGGQLATAAYRADAQIEASIVKGSPPSAPAGRADDLKWPVAGMPNP